MSRSGYSYDCEPWEAIRWRGAVKSALCGKRGQAFLREALEALDALPRPELITNSLHEVECGEVCTLGAVGLSRGLDMSGVDAENTEDVGRFFGIARAMTAEIEYENDEAGWGPEPETPAERFTRMRNWIESKIVNKD